MKKIHCYSFSLLFSTKLYTYSNWIFDLFYRHTYTAFISNPHYLFRLITTRETEVQIVALLLAESSQSNAGIRDLL